MDKTAQATPSFNEMCSLSLDWITFWVPIVSLLVAAGTTVYTLVPKRKDKAKTNDTGTYDINNDTHNTRSLQTRMLMTFSKIKRVTVARVRTPVLWIANRLGSGFT